MIIENHLSSASDLDASITTSTGFNVSVSKLKLVAE